MRRHRVPPVNGSTLLWCLLILDGKRVGEWRPVADVTTPDGWVKFNIDRCAVSAAIAFATSPNDPITDMVTAASPVKPGDWVGFKISDLLR